MCAIISVQVFCNLAIGKGVIVVCTYPDLLRIRTKCYQNAIFCKSFNCVNFNGEIG